jgi:hypothetical protein
VEAVEADKTEHDIAGQATVELSRMLAKDKARVLFEEEQHKDRPRTWVVTDHDAAFALADQRPMPDIGHMVDAPSSPPLPLIYSGKINGVHGDSEAGKSWLAMHMAIQEMNRGRRVMYVDFEDDAGSVYGRLLALGIHKDRLREFFRYIRPEGKLTVFEAVEFAQEVCTDQPHSLAVIDGVTEAMAMEGLTGRDEAEVARWHQILTKPLAAAGWGVFMIDHTPHGENRAIGSQHKRSAITGVSYWLESIKPFAKGQKGRSRLRVEKDRPGWIRGEAAAGERPQWYGDFTLDSTGLMEAAVWPWLPPSEEEEAGYTAMPPERVLLAVCAFVGANPGCSQRAIRTGVVGRTDEKIWAAEWLIEKGYIEKRPGPNRAVDHFLTETYVPSDGAASLTGGPAVVPQVVPSGPQDHGTTQESRFPWSGEDE